MSTVTLDPHDPMYELKWLQAWPEFEERPATLREFLGPHYLNIDGFLRPRILAELEEIMGVEVRGDRVTRYPLAMITGGIGIGKTTVASIVLPYLVHWLLCLKNPQRYFNLLPGSRIAFMQMSTSEGQAKEVIFGDIKARILYSPWFQSKYPFNPQFKNEIRFPKDLWILPGDSAETTFEGYNIFGGILDEADSHKLTENKDYAETGFNTIHARITSRFEDKGFLLVIGQMKSQTGFAARKYSEFKNNPDAYAVRLAIWESYGWEHYRGSDGKINKFYYDPIRKEIVPNDVGDLMKSGTFLEIPNVFRRDFLNSPEKALRDLAGIPPAVEDPFIALTDRIHVCRDRWIESHGGYESPVRPDGRLEPWFKALEPLRRAVHIDLGISGDGDALGFAMGHVRELVQVDDELKPYIVIDLLMRWQAPSGSEIFISDVRHFLYHLRNDLKFRIQSATLDGFQSTDTIQQFQRRRIESEVVSIDKQKLPYEDVREAIYEGRIEFPKYLTRYHRGDLELVEIAVKELTELVDDGKKIDHPEGGSKDVSDAIAGVTTKLMGDRTFSRKVVQMQEYKQKNSATGTDGLPWHPALRGLQGDGLKAPIPPNDWTKLR